MLIPCISVTKTGKMSGFLFTAADPVLDEHQTNRVLRKVSPTYVIYIQHCTQSATKMCKEASSIFCQVTENPSKYPAMNEWLEKALNEKVMDGYSVANQQLAKLLEWEKQKNKALETRMDSLVSNYEHKMEVLTSKHEQRIAELERRNDKLNNRLLLALETKIQGLLDANFK